MRLVGEVNIHKTDFLQPRGKASIRHKQVCSRLRVKRPHMRKGRKTSFRCWISDTGLSNGWGRGEKTMFSDFVGECNDAIECVLFRGDFDRMRLSALHVILESKSHEKLFVHVMCDIALQCHSETLNH